jgi:type II secretory ATPase GspE/PulE/Tfp pilus assembly ATPase PilB-like protein
VSDAPVVELVNAILLSAIKHGATAIRIRRADERACVELVFDGAPYRAPETREEIRPPLALFAPIVRRLGVMASLPYRGREIARGTFALVVDESRRFDFELEVAGHGETETALVTIRRS